MTTELLKTKQIPGLAISVGRNGTMIRSEGFGLADVEQNVAVTPLTRFRLGSISKVITAAGLARLLDAGKLDLDAPVQHYVPRFPVKEWPVTTRQLAGHTSGIRHYSDEDFTTTLKSSPHFDSVTGSLSIFANDPLSFEPGTQYAYSSYGWNLISAVVEGASGQEFLQFMQDQVFDPLALHGIIADHPFEIVPFRSAFYIRDRKNVLLNAPFSDSSYKWASGGFLGTAEDLVRFASAHLQEGFFRKATLDVLFTSQKLASGKETGVGLGWRLGMDAAGRPTRHHAGSIEGGRAILLMFPDSGVVIAILANVYADFGENEAMTVAGLFIE